MYLTLSSLRVIPTSSSRYVTIRRKRSMTEVRGRMTRASRAAAFGAGGGIWHNGQVSRPLLLPRAWGRLCTRAVEHVSDGGRKASARAPHPTGPRRCRARECGRSGCAVGAPGTCARAHVRCQPAKHRHDRRAPEIASRRPRPRSDRAPGAAAAARGAGARGASFHSLDDTCTATTSTSVPSHVDRAHQRRHARRTGRRGCWPIGSSRRARIGNREQIASSHVPFAGYVVPRPRAADRQRREHERLDPVAVGGQVVEHAAAVVARATTRAPPRRRRRSRARPRRRRTARGRARRSARRPSGR